MTKGVKTCSALNSVHVRSSCNNWESDAFVGYRKDGAQRTSQLHDFYICICEIERLINSNFMEIVAI